MLPISKSKGRAVLREAEEEKCVGEGGNFITTRHTQIAHRFFFFALHIGGRKVWQGIKMFMLILVNKGWKNTTRYIEVIRPSNCSLSLRENTSERN